MRIVVFIFILIIVAGVVLAANHFAAPVPFCKIANGSFNTTERVGASDLVKYNLTLVHVDGTSMLPTILNNSNCLCAKKKNYSVGDIVVFPFILNGQRVEISHRINKIEGNLILTKGDNNNWVDPPTLKSNILCSIPEVPKILNNLY